MAGKATQQLPTPGEAAKAEESALEELVQIVSALEKTMKVAGRTTGRAQQRAVAAGAQLREGVREALNVESKSAGTLAEVIRVPDLFDAPPAPDNHPSTKH